MKIRTSDHFYTSLMSFTQLTIELIRLGELAHLKACFNIAEKLLKEGEPLVKSGIRGRYISSLQSFLKKHPLRSKIINFMPLLLLTEYAKLESEAGQESDNFVFTLYLN